MWSGSHTNTGVHGEQFSTMYIKLTEWIWIPLGGGGPDAISQVLMAFRVKDDYLPPMLYHSHHGRIWHMKERIIENITLKIRLYPNADLIEVPISDQSKFFLPNHELNSIGRSIKWWEWFKMTTSSRQLSKFDNQKIKHFDFTTKMTVFILQCNQLLRNTRKKIQIEEKRKRKKKKHQKIHIGTWYHRYWLNGKIRKKDEGRRKMAHYFEQWWYDPQPHYIFQKNEKTSIEERWPNNMNEELEKLKTK